MLDQTTTETFTHTKLGRPPLSATLSVTLSVTPRIHELMHAREVMTLNCTKLLLDPKEVFGGP